MTQRLISHIQYIQDSSLRRTCESILTYDKFFAWPASLSHHHAYEGGLLAHTIEVCDIALGILGTATSRVTYEGCPTVRENFKVDGVSPTRDILIAAALWHDVMKTEEYIDVDRAVCETTNTRHAPYGQYGAWIKDSSRVKLFGHHEHIIAGAMEFTKLATWHVVNTDTIDAVTHCILAHHGRKEWGSPVEPQTIEALILHQADMLSAKFGATKEVAL